jgi:hypothetical protein
MTRSFRVLSSLWFHCDALDDDLRMKFGYDGIPVPTFRCFSFVVFLSELIPTNIGKTCQAPKLVLLDPGPPVIVGMFRCRDRSLLSRVMHLAQTGGLR